MLVCSRSEWHVFLCEVFKWVAVQFFRGHFDSRFKLDLQSSCFDPTRPLLWLTDSLLLVTIGSCVWQLKARHYKDHRGRWLFKGGATRAGSSPVHRAIGYEACAMHRVGKRSCIRHLFRSVLLCGIRSFVRFNPNDCNAHAASSQI